MMMIVRSVIPLGQCVGCQIMYLLARLRSRSRSQSGGAGVWPFLLEPEPEWEFLEPAPKP